MAECTPGDAALGVAPKPCPSGRACEYEDGAALGHGAGYCAVERAPTAPAPHAHPRGPAAVFYDADGVAVPLACYAPRFGLAGDAAVCLSLLHKGDAMASASGGVHVVRAVEPRNRCKNEPSHTSPGLRTEDTTGERVMVSRGFFVWPQASAEWIVVPRDAGDAVPFNRLPGDERRRLSLALGAQTGVHLDKASVARALDVDLDGDGVPDTLYTITQEGSGGFSGLLVGWGSRPMAVPDVVVAETDTTYAIYGALDLDGDGQLELFVRRRTHQGSVTESVERLQGGRLVAIGMWSCNEDPGD